MFSETSHKIGNRYHGTVLNILGDGSIAVELLTGEVGCIKGSNTQNHKFEVSDKIFVELVEVDYNNNLYFSFLNKSNYETNDSGVVESTFGKWNNMQVGHNMPMVLFHELNNFCNDYLKELNLTHTEHNNKVAANLETFNAISLSVQEECKSEIRTHESECFVNCDNDKKRISVADDLHKEYDSKIKTINRSYYKVSDKLMKGISGSLNTYLTTVFARDYQNVKNAINKKIDAHNLIKDIKINESMRNAQEKTNTARSSQINNDSQVEISRKNSINKIINNKQNELNNGITREMLRRYTQSVKASKLNVQNFECAVQVPEFIHFGNLIFEIPNKNNNEQLFKLLRCKHQMLAMMNLKNMLYVCRIAKEYLMVYLF